MATIRDYNVTVSNITASITVNDGSKTSYAALPTLAEIRRVTGQPVEVINLNQCFMNCGALTTAPAIPNGVIDMNACFFGCESLTTAPTIPNSVTNMDNCFAYCTALAIAPAIPTSVTNMVNCFRNCKSLTTAPTIPSSVTRMSDCFAYCTALTGKITIDANPSGYVNCMAYTQKEIVLTGSSTLLQNIADTATNSNVYVWSLSINLSAERQKDDLSKADVSVIINRFRNNNESVSLTFTINRVESTPVQVTMDTATKTYTGVLSIPPFSIVELSVIAEDSYGKSAPKSITIPIPFYTIDFQAGGREIAVGAPANDDISNRPYGLFKCVMDAQFGRNVEFDGNLVLGTALSIANGGTGATGITTAIPTLTKSSGSSTLTATAYTWGNLVQLSFSLATTAETAVGSSVWKGTIADGYRPKNNTTFVGFSGSSGIVCLIGSDGYIELRVIGAKLPSSYNSKFGGMFIKG